MYKKIGFIVFVSLFSFVSSDAVLGQDDLIDAVVTGDLTEVKRVVEAGVNINQGELLCDAVRNGFRKISRYLIDKGIDLNQKDIFHGDTPLHLVAKNDAFISANGNLITGVQVDTTCLEIITMLVEAGADLTCKDDDGNTPLQAAKMGKKTQRAAYLQLASDLCRVVAKDLSLKNFAKIYLADGVSDADEKLSMVVRIAFYRGHTAFFGELLSWMLGQKKYLFDKKYCSKMLAVYFMWHENNPGIRKVWLERLTNDKNVAEDLAGWVKSTVYTVIKNSLLSPEEKLLCTNCYSEQL